MRRRPRPAACVWWLERVLPTKSASDSDPSPPQLPIRSRYRFRPSSASTRWGDTEIGCYATKERFRATVKLMRGSSCSSAEIEDPASTQG